MRKLPHANSFQELLVYQNSRKLSNEIFELTKTFPREEMFSLSDQMRRSSRSVGAQIAEAWAKRRYEKHFVSKLTDADGELQETVHWIETAADCEYLSSDLTLDLKSQCAEIGRLIGGMIAKSALFCKGSDRSVREPVGDYFIDNTSDNW
jgi:four helix bundle protein